MTREEWLEERKKGIGGSDAAAILGKTKWKTNTQLWEEKTRRREIEDISDKPCIQYGTKMEPILRESFKIKHPEYKVLHEEYKIIRHPKYPFLFASLDGEIVEIATGEMGVLEIKTANLQSTSNREEWRDANIPINYYCQVLHYLNVTGYSFVRLFAELTYAEDYQPQKTYEIAREDVEEDIKELEKAEIKFWTEYVEKDVRPPLQLEL